MSAVPAKNTRGIRGTEHTAQNSRFSTQSRDIKQPFCCEGGYEEADAQCGGALHSHTDPLTIRFHARPPRTTWTLVSSGSARLILRISASLNFGPVWCFNGSIIWPLAARSPARFTQCLHICSRPGTWGRVSPWDSPLSDLRDVCLVWLLCGAAFAVFLFLDLITRSYESYEG
jgi:hypothetical protein